MAIEVFPVAVPPPPPPPPVPPTYTISGLSRKQLQALTLLVGGTSGNSAELYRKLYNALGKSHAVVIAEAEQAHPTVKGLGVVEY